MATINFLFIWLKNVSEGIILHLSFSDAVVFIWMQFFIYSWGRLISRRRQPVILISSDIFGDVTKTIMTAPRFSKLRNVNMTAIFQIAKFLGPTWGPPGSYRPQMGPCWPQEPCYQGCYACFRGYPRVALQCPAILDGAPYYSTTCRRSVCASANTGLSYYCWSAWKTVWYCRRWLQEHFDEWKPQMSITTSDITNHT